MFCDLLTLSDQASCCVLQVIVVGGLGETLGWAGRIWSSKNDTNHSAFILQIVLLIIMPCFYSAATYGFLADLIGVVGPEYSLLG